MMARRCFNALKQKQKMGRNGAVLNVSVKAMQVERSACAPLFLCLPRPG